MKNWQPGTRDGGAADVQRMCSARDARDGACDARDARDARDGARDDTAF